VVGERKAASSRGMSGPGLRGFGRMGFPITAA
jgi:hypothetical protein